MSLPQAILIDPNDGCLTIARSLVKRGVPVRVLARSRSSYVAASRGVQAGRVLPGLPAGEGAWIERLRGLARDGDGVLIAGSDNAVELVMRNRAAIPEQLVSFESPESQHLRIMDKASLYEIAREVGVRVPWVISLTSRAELDGVVERASYPCVVKPALKHVGEALGFAVSLVRGPDDLRRICEGPVEHGVEMLVTEFVPGPETNLEGAVTVRAPDGSYVVEYERHKIRQHPLDFGPGTLTRSAPVPETMADSKRIQDQVGYVGIASYEAKRHAETGERVLIEINVRVVQSFGLGQACGADAPWRLYATLAGIPLPPRPAQRDGVNVVSPAFDYRAVRDRIRRRELTVADAVRSYRGTRDFSIVDPRDPGPGLAFLRWAVGSKLEKQPSPAAARAYRVISAPRPFREAITTGLRKAPLIEHSPFTVTYRDGIRLRLRDGSFGVWADPEGHYSHADVDFLERYLRRGDTYVDVGAHIGLHTVAAARRVGGAGRVYSFEPHPRTYRHLVDHVVLNQLPQVRCFNCALSTSAGSARLTDSREPYRNFVTRNGSGVDVATRTLDDAVPGDASIALLKIDVEGYERFVLEGGADTLARTACVYIECWDEHFKRFGYTAADVVELLESAGLSLYRLDDGLVPVGDGEPPGATLENLVAIRDVADFQERTGIELTGLARA